MLTFLRKIRKSLIASGSARKYFLYAIGEIALVVIGILIALQINNWNEWRKDRLKEVEVLKELVHNIETNVNFIQFSINRNKMDISSYHTIINGIENGIPWNDTLGVHFRNALNTRVPTFSFSAYESLKDRGVELILNTSLQKEISALYENYNHAYTVITRIVNNELKPNISDFVIANFEPTKNNLANPRFDVLTAYMPNDFESLKKNQKFINLLNFIQSYRAGYIQILETRSLAQSERILQVIKDELGEEYTENESSEPLSQ